MIERDDIDGIAVVRLAHGKVNALDLELLLAITETFRELSESDADAIVFTGAGRAFSAGVDLWRIVDGGEEYARAYLPALSECFSTVFDTGKPVVAAVNGHAIAGGCILVACCDRRLMSAGRIGVTELPVGVPFPMTPLEILTYACGARYAREAVLTGATYEPAEALARGLVDEVVASDSLLDRALAEARRLSRLCPADTFQLTKRQLHLDVNERLARHRSTLDALAARLWEQRIADGTIRAYMQRVTAGGG